MKMLAMLAASTSLGFMSDTCEVVLAKIKGSSDPVRVNKDAFDADQEKPAGDREYSPYKGSDEPEQSFAGDPRRTFEELGIDPVAAPSAPDFSGGADEAPLPIDPNKNAAAQQTIPSGQCLVMKKGRKFIIVDAEGNPVEDEGVQKDGYITEKDAWEAVVKLTESRAR